MMYEGTLFNPGDVERGERGEGLNMSIEEFKKIREARLQEWVNSVKKLSITERLKFEEALKHHYQWEDFTTIGRW